MIFVSPCIVGLIPADAVTRLNDRSTVTCVLLARQIAVGHNLPGSLTCTCAVCPQVQRGVVEEVERGLGGGVAVDVETEIATLLAVVTCPGALATVTTTERLHSFRVT